MFYDFGEKIEFDRFSRNTRFAYSMLFELISSIMAVFLQAGSQAGIYLASAFGLVSVADIISVSIANGLVFYAVNAIFNRFGAGYTNPFVAIAFNWFKKDEKVKSVWKRLFRLVSLILMQMIGSVIAALLIWGIIGDGTLASGFKLNLGRPNIDAKRTVGQALGFEIIGTFILIFTVIFANSDLMFHPDIALIGGFMVVVLNVVGIPISGASMNWWRHFGPTLVSNSWRSTDWIYYVGPLIGASAVFVLYRIVIYSMKKPRKKEGAV